MLIASHHSSNLSLKLIGFYLSAFSVHPSLNLQLQIGQPCLVRRLWVWRNQPVRSIT